MSVELIGIISIIAGLIGLFSGVKASLVLMSIAAVLQSAAALLVAGANIPPGHVVLGFLMLAVLTRRQVAKALVRELGPDRPGFWLALMVAYGILSAFFVPRLLADQTIIIPLGQTIHAETGSGVPLAPVSTNITQTIYMIGNLVVFLLVAAVASTRDGLRAAVAALLAYSMATVFFAVVDLVTFSTGLQWTMEFIRNAQYALHVDTEIAGMKRIVGSFTEASAFARSALGVLGFSGTMWLCGRRSGLTGGLAVSSAVLVVLSTSSTGLAGAPVMMMILYATAVILVGQSHGSRIVVFAVITAPLLTIAVVLVAALNEDLWRPAFDYINLVVLDKAGSDSGVERSAWNAYAMRNVFETGGIGLGLGTVRTSSFLVALLVSVGVPGTLLYFVFAYQALLRHQGSFKSFEGSARLAACNGCLGLLIGDLVVSPSVDQGLFFYILAAVSSVGPVQAARSAETDILELRHVYRA